MSGTRTISSTSRRELSSSFFFPLQGKAPKEIHAILTETLACFLPGLAKDLSASLYSGVPRGVWGVQTPHSEFPKVLQNHAKLNPIVKTVKNC